VPSTIRRIAGVQEIKERDMTMFLRPKPGRLDAAIAFLGA